MRLQFSIILLFALLCGSVMAQSPPAAAKADDASGWKEFSSAEGKFKVLLPGVPKTNVGTAQTAIGPLTTHYFAVETEKFVYHISYVDLPVGPETPEETKEALDSSRDHAVKDHRLISENDVTLDGIVGREMLVARNDLIFNGRFFYVKKRLYHLILGARANVVFRDGKPSADAKDRTDLFRKTSKKFFDSFTLTK